LRVEDDDECPVDMSMLAIDHSILTFGLFRSSDDMVVVDDDNLDDRPARKLYHS